MDEKKKGIFIEESIKTRFDLSWNEKAVLVQINYMSNSMSVSRICNATLSKQLGISERTIRSVLKSLYEKKEIMFQRRTDKPHSPDRFIYLYNKRFITMYERKEFPFDKVILEYKK